MAVGLRKAIKNRQERMMQRVDLAWECVGKLECESLDDMRKDGCAFTQQAEAKEAFLKIKRAILELETALVACQRPHLLKGD